ncbi:hypothetical protein KJY77_04000 [Canibacter sp. lx-72]|uniref:hypothetical protein n=1 Tax=Canibacter zhuwentaonis TaxID=2837491 RepID=UPI001BDD129E|nr:hypothetical protein [Canibacter zhuwentaonis]MBT1018301.1 hypothetical protein [Canibacter zhuwentaonis]MBT1035489.1 hypothetical protein [Canibacter zhuwentaonis]
MAAQRLQLTWYNKDKALIPTEKGKYGYTWVDPSDPRYCETHTLVYDEFVRGGGGKLQSLMSLRTPSARILNRKTIIY